MIASLKAWFRQPDVRTHPLRALWRRLRWRWHWRNGDADPFLVRRWWRGTRIALPHSGSAAVAYYRDFEQDPIVRAMERFIRPGDTILDIGAHIGAYTIVAAHLTGPTGRVIGIEPQSALAALIRRNLNANSFSHASVREVAIGAALGEVRFAADSRTHGGWIAPEGAEHHAFTTPMITLDTIGAEVGRVGFVKVDAAGFEPDVLRGGKDLLSQADAPALAVKFYHPDVIAERLGHPGPDLRHALENLGYSLFEWLDGRWLPFHREIAEYSLVVLATRQPGNPG